MNILICKQGLFGGTDNLLERYYIWLRKEEINAVIADCRNGIYPSKKIKYDLVLLPSSQMGDLFLLKKKGYQIERMLVWILGMGAFRDSYYNSCQEGNAIKKYLNNYLLEKANDALECIWMSNSIIFTDEVGAYNTFRTVKIDYKSKINDILIPIAISVPDKLLKQNYTNNKQVVRLSWIGRVSNDFKKIPIKHIIEDIENYVKESGVMISLTVVGDGDALSEIKEYAGNRNYQINFISNIAYDRLDEFITTQVDLLIAMGTSALDGAKTGCPTIVINPIRETDPNNVYYRWIHESEGYSLGEFPGMEIQQEKKTFEQIMEEYFEIKDLNLEAYNYAKEFELNYVFHKLNNRTLPDKINEKIWGHLKFFYRLVKTKKMIKRILIRNVGRKNNYDNAK